MSRLGKILLLFAGLSIVSFAIIRFLIGGWVPFLWFALGFTILFILAAFFVDRKFFSEFFFLRTTRQGMSMGAMIIMVLSAIVALNFLGSRHYKTWDLSLNKVNTLSEQSQKLAGSLQETLKVIYFYQDGATGVDQNKRLFMELIKKYQDINSKIQLEFVEVNERPDLTAKYNISKGSSLVLLEYKDKTNVIEKIDEQELTSALAKVTREKDKHVYILEGHGEVGLAESEDGRSLSLFKTLLEGNRYTVNPFNFNQSAQLPSDADVLVIVGPSQNFLEFEIKAIENYLAQGGSLVLALEPGKNPGLDALTQAWGISPARDVVVTVLETPFGNAVDPRVTKGVEFSKESTITKPFGKSEVTIFRMPQGLVKLNQQDGQPPKVKDLELIELVKTNSQSMSFTDLNFKGQGNKGPFTLVYEIKGSYALNGSGGEASAQPFHAVVIGDEDILTNQLLYQNLNRDLALNMVSALAKEDTLISITPKEVSATKMELTPTQFLIYIFGFIIPFPVVLYILSGVIWFKRRSA